MADMISLALSKEEIDLDIPRNKYCLLQEQPKIIYVEQFFFGIYLGS